MLQAVKRKLAGRGPGEILGLLIKNVVHAARSASPAAAASRQRDGAFDRQWGTETSGLVNLGDLSVDRQRARHGVRYQPSDDGALARAISTFRMDPREWTLVDYGSGKGRVALQAIAGGFAQAIGVEFSPELVRTAEENGRIFQAAGGADRQPRFVLGDAGAYDPPAGPLLAYFYNPFGPSVLDEVIARLEAKARTGDPVLVAYLDPRHLDRFAADRWTRVDGDPVMTLLRAR
jgi:precorrin-6B methylase 2